MNKDLKELCLTGKEDVIALDLLSFNPRASSNLLDDHDIEVKMAVNENKK